MRVTWDAQSGSHDQVQMHGGVDACTGYLLSPYIFEVVNVEEHST